jgi:hypothetical protein
MSIDHRILNLSYSSLTTLHSCPRKFELYKKNSKEQLVDDGGSSDITFAFGHAVGDGLAASFKSDATENSIIWDLFKSWNCDLEARDDKRNKNFYKAVFAVQKFIALRRAGFLKDYDLVYHNGKPAIELGFCINFPDGFKLRGYVDVVLRNRITGEVVVLECKTTSQSNINPAIYKNSSQAIGYSVVLDVLFPKLSSYKVIYIVYETKAMEWKELSFSKSYLQRALWIRELLLDIETIKMYEEATIYPMRGENCFNFYRECEYLNLCTLSTQHLTTPEPTEEDRKVEVFDINITLADMIQSQLSKEVETTNG